MPKKEINYQNSVIYKIISNDLTIKDLYVGSTTNFNIRKAHHKIVCNDPNNKLYNIPLYKTIRENGGWDNWDMILVENYPCNNKNELHARERHFIDELKSNLNLRLPIRTKQEKKIYQNEYDKNYREINREELNKSDKIRWQQRKEERNQQRRETIIICECGSKLRLSENERHKKTIRHRNWLEGKKEITLCECGGKFGEFGKLRHERSKKHLKWLEIDKE
jgi:hypothetical protein